MSLHTRYGLKHNKANPVTIPTALEDIRPLTKAIGSKTLCRPHFAIRNNLLVHCRITTAAFLFFFP